jgi:hypothetical protein
LSGGSLVKEYLVWENSYQWHWLKKTSRLCEFHFKEEDIVKEDKFIIDGQVKCIPRQNWTLKKDAYPQIFPCKK